MNNWQTMLFSSQGRIRRSQYWLWSLGTSFALGVIIGIAAVAFRGDAQGHGSPLFGLIYFAGLIVAVIIGVNLQVKRWHDRDKSGWWTLIGFVPLIGGIWAFVECGCLDGTQGPNKYGPSPKGIGAPQNVF